MGPLYALLVTIVLSSGPHSEFRCDELSSFGTDDGEGDPGGWVAGDSRGHVVIEADPMVMFCEARAPGYNQWFGFVTVRKDTKRIDITLTKKPTGAK